MKLLTALLALTTSFAASAIMPDQVRFCQAQGSYAEQAFVSRSVGVTEDEAISLITKAGFNDATKSTVVPSLRLFTRWKCQPILKTSP